LTTRTLHLFRKAFGLTLALVGLAGLVADLHVAYLGRSAAHATNLVVCALLVFAGGWLLNPPDAEGIADAIAKRVPVLSSLWPGGRRRDDPPPQPGVPPPPSVTERD
jgi:hypothetical protein